MNPCCVSDGSCCAPPPTTPFVIGVSVSVELSFGGCCCSINDCATDGCCRVVLSAYSTGVVDGQLKGDECDKGCCMEGKEKAMEAVEAVEEDCCSEGCCEEIESNNGSETKEGDEEKIEVKECSDGCCSEEEIGCGEESRCCREEEQKNEMQLENCCAEGKCETAKATVAPLLSASITCQDDCCNEENEDNDEMNRLDEEKMDDRRPKDDKEPLITKNTCKDNDNGKGKEKEKCKAGCCPPAEDVKGNKNEEERKEEERCGGGCCETKEERVQGPLDGSRNLGNNITEHKVEICCSLCWNGNCCQQGCCKSTCCVKITVVTNSNVCWPFSFSLSSTWDKWMGATGGDEVAFLDHPIASSSSSSHDPSLLHVQIGGMTCTDCATGIQKCLLKVPGISSADVVYMTGKGQVGFEKDLVGEEDIIAQIQKLGFSAAEIPQNSSTETKFTIAASPEHESSELENLLKQLDGVSQVVMDQRENSLRVIHDFNVISPRTLATHIRSAGWVPSVFADKSRGGVSSDNLVWGWKWRFWASTVLAIPVVLVAYILPSFSSTSTFVSHDIAPGLSLRELLACAFATPIQFGISARLYASAWKSLRYARKANVDALVMLSSSVAYLYSLASMLASLAHKEHEGESFFETCAILLTLIMFGRYIETVAKEKTRKHLTQLVDVPPRYTIVNSDGTTEEHVEVEWLGIGDVVQVVPGEKIIADGVVVFGTSFVDESMLTGESVPIVKQVGDTVCSGSINQHGALHVRTTKRASDSTFAQVRKLVDNAQASRAQLQRTTDVLASYFVPFIVFITLCVFFSWLGVSGSLPFALRFAIAVLVVACPCALALSAPTAVMAGMEVGARMGVLFKGGGPVLETLHAANVVVFDKTGTLTRGTPAVVSHRLFAQHHAPCVRRSAACSADGTPCATCASALFFTMVACAESGSEHPLGRALVQHAQAVYACEPHAPSSFSSTAGKGVVCEVENSAVCIGNMSWMRENGIKIDPQTESISQSEGDGETVIHVGIDGQMAGSISCIDLPRPEAKSVVSALTTMGLEVWMISGDNPATAGAVGRLLGISNIMGGVLPADKCAKIKQLQALGKKVVMVGDGVNDAPALAQANVGIAMGRGANIATDTAGVVLMKEDLRDVIVAIDLSCKTFRRIAWNLAWAVAYNVCAILVAAGALQPVGVEIPPSVAGVSEIVSSVPILLASFLLHRYKAPTVRV